MANAGGAWDNAKKIVEVELNAELEPNPNGADVTFVAAAQILRMLIVLALAPIAVMLAVAAVACGLAWVKAAVAGGTTPGRGARWCGSTAARSSTRISLSTPRPAASCSATRA